jgi:hypothetical protein
MKKKIFQLKLTIAVLILATNVHAQIAGKVFRDYNSNGTRDSSNSIVEPFVSNITVKAFNAANVQLGTTKTTNASGSYVFTALEIPATTKVRIEFSGLTTNDFSSFSGTSNGTNVQFATAGATIDYAINAADDYWNSLTQANPKLLNIVYGQGDINHVHATNTNFGIIQIDNNATNRTPTKVNVANQAQVGSVWGMAYHKYTNRFFFSSFLKRHVGIGPRGIGGVYMADQVGANYSLSGGFSLQGVVPSNDITPINLGTINRVTTNNDDNELSTGTDTLCRDIDAFAKIGKAGFGDIEVDEKNQQLVMVNLFQRSIITVDISGTTNLNNAHPDTLKPLTKSFDILTLPGKPSCSNGQLRPFALKIYKGRGYLGAVCDGAATPRDSTNLAGYVLSFDPTNVAAGFRTELTLNMNYRTSFSNANSNSWHSWANDWSNVYGSGYYRYPQPMITNLEFDEKEGMSIAITDRFGHQMSPDQILPVTGSNTQLLDPRVSGDLLHACKVGNSWIMEGTTGACAVLNRADTTDGYGDGPIFGIPEYYNDASGDAVVVKGRGEFGQGALAKIMGTNKLVNTIVDPAPSPGGQGGVYFFSGGLHWYDVNNGSWNNWTTLYDSDDPSMPKGTYKKGNGLGDIEFALAPSTIEIGNRIWLDANGNGIQDADETTAGVPAGTTVTLRSPGLNALFGDMDDQTWTTITDANGNYYFSNLSSVDNRKPANWVGIGATVLMGYTYRIEVATPTGAILTSTNIATNSVDNIDNDAIINGNRAEVIFNTTNTSHNFDFGFKQLASLGNKVWLDEGAGGGTAKDGIQNGTEPGVASVAVALYQNGTDGTPNTTDDVLIGTTVTDAYGIYSFNNLVPSTTVATSYHVAFTLPANHQFTIQTNTQIMGTSNATNTTSTVGLATAATGSDVNVAIGRTGSFWLEPAEQETGVDAGIVFTIPTLPNSIGDKVWLDVDSDGIQDNNEPGIAGIVVVLLNDATTEVLTTTLTDANGNYIFNDLPAFTNYKIKVIPPTSMVLTNSTGTTITNNSTNSDVTALLSDSNYGLSATVNTGIAGTNVTGIDAGLITQNSTAASLGDKVWNDLNNNGIQDAGEPGIANVTVNLYEDADGNNSLSIIEQTQVKTTTTDVFGNYIFNNLIPTASNKWQVEFVQPSTFSNTSIMDNNANNDADDSDITNNSTDRTAFIRLVNKERNTKVDAGFVKTTLAGTLILGDKVWRDNNNNGQQDLYEPGVVGTLVKLFQNGVDGLPKTADDILIATTSTDIKGNYRFVNLAASSSLTTNYNVQFSNLPIGFIFTQKNIGSTTTDNDANMIGNTGSINLIATDTTIDAGIKQGLPSGLASLGNKVWFDLNTNGKQDSTEFGVQGVLVSLYNDTNRNGTLSGVELTAVATTLTNSLGEYMFNSLQASDYQVAFTLPSSLSAYSLATKDASDVSDEEDSDGFAKNTSIAGNIASAQTSYTNLISLSQGEDNITIDLGLIPPANTNTLGNLVWFDVNANGLQDTNEPGVPGVIVILYNTSGTQIATTTTDKLGNYLFVGLADGNYSVSFKNYPPGFEVTIKSLSNDLIGSDADNINGNTVPVTLNYTTGGTSRNNVSLDAGLVSTRAVLGNKVWDDLNGDGLQNTNEPGVPGVQVILYNNDSTTVITSTITDQSGYYLFANLAAADYVIGINTATLPIGKQYTEKNNPIAPADNLVNYWTAGGDSDIDQLSGQSAIITLATNEINFTKDAGIRSVPIATVGNRVWDDTNKDGMQDTEEPGVAGVIATLYNSNDQPISSAITNGKGEWLITNVAPGSGYYVIFSNKPNGNFTLQDQGANAAGTGGAVESDMDSDVNSSGQTGAFNVTANDLKIVIDAGIAQITTLPVKYISFTASKQNVQSVLKFEIAQPAPTSTFIVERSTSGTSYLPIGSLSGTIGTVFHFIDNAPNTAVKNYYRIKEIEASGAVSYSEIKWVQFAKGSKVEIYPIPAKNNLNIIVEGPLANKNLTVSLYNAYGKQILLQQISNGSSIHSIQVSNYAAGIYQLVLSYKGEIIESKKVIITK